MRDELYGSAQRWARLGVDAYSREPDKDFAVLHAAVALEHLAKAYLCSLHPTLIAASGDFDTLLHMVGHGNHAGTPRHRIRTIGLADACKRVKQLLKTAFPYDGKPDDPVLVARNGVAHAALWRREDIRETLTVAVRRIDAILVAFGTDRAEFWGLHADLTTRLIDQAVTDIVLRLETLISGARRRYEERFGTLPDEAKQAILSALTARPRYIFDHDLPHECLACGNQAWLGGTTETRWDLDTIDTPYGEAARPVVVFYPDYLLCSVCDLELYEEVLHHSDIEEMIELPDAEPDIPEPDLDWLPDINESDES